MCGGTVHELAEDFSIASTLHFRVLAWLVLPSFRRPLIVP